MAAPRRCKHCILRKATNGRHFECVFRCAPVKPVVPVDPVKPVAPVKPVRPADTPQTLLLHSHEEQWHPRLLEA